jgi:hypothetical protein
MRGFVRSVAKAGVHKHHKHDDKHAEAGMGTCRSVSQYHSDCWTVPWHWRTGCLLKRAGNKTSSKNHLS